MSDERIEQLAQKHGLSTGAVEAVRDALARGGGRMAQFSHPEFGGMAQWSPGMTMVGDMFNDALKAKLDAVASALARDGSEHGAEPAPQSQHKPASPQRENWWPGDLGRPSSSGSQNAMRYAIFGDNRRLVIDDNGRITVYDTGDARISGISQAQSGSQSLRFSSDKGEVRLEDLKRID